MPDDERTDEDVAADERPVFSGYGIASAALGLLSVAADRAGGADLVGAPRRRRRAPLPDRVLEAAADWTTVLVNMNKDDIDASLQKLHDGTVGELNAEFESALEPYKKLVQTLQSRTQGPGRLGRHRVDLPPPADHARRQARAVADPAAGAGRGRHADRHRDGGGDVDRATTSAASRRPLRWNLRLDVSDVDGKLLISRLEQIR